MVASTGENGLTTTWMELVFTPGRTAENTRVSIKMTKSKDMEFTLGPMAACTRVTGGEVNNMAWVATLCQANRLSTDFGKKERE